MNVKLIAQTQGVGDLAGLSLGEILAYVARVSNPDNQMSHDTAPRLLAYCLKNQHWSVFETAFMTLEITTSRAISAQILRHRSFTFQERCVAGDTMLYFDLPRSERTGQRHLHKMTIADACRKWNQDSFRRQRVAGMRLRCYDSVTDSFKHTNIVDVYQTGEKPAYKVILADGKSITCTEDHKFFVKDAGWKTLKEACGLGLTATGKATLDNRALFACNGVPVHQDKEWLEAAKQRSLASREGLPGIASEAGVSYHTIRKWLRIHKLQFTRAESASITDVWNKGKTGYKLTPWTDQARANVRAAAKKGSDSPLWRGGVDRPWRLQVTDFVGKYRTKFLIECDYTCSKCKKRGGKLELHHKEPVYARPELAFDLSNIEVVCKNCHYEEHGKTLDTQKWRETSTGNKLLKARYVPIETIEYVGVIPTYDLEVADEEHNYIANGIVTHNSMRYATHVSGQADYLGQAGFELYPARRQDDKNRQNSIDDMDEETRRWFHNVQVSNNAAAKMLYDDAIKKGIAKEQARFLLPLSTETVLYMTGNVRSWLTYCKLRTTPGTQKEHRDIAVECKKILLDLCPELNGAYWE